MQTIYLGPEKKIYYFTNPFRFELPSEVGGYAGYLQIQFTAGISASQVVFLVVKVTSGKANFSLILPDLDSFSSPQEINGFSLKQKNIDILYFAGMKMTKL